MTNDKAQSFHLLILHYSPDYDLWSMLGPTVHTCDYKPIADWPCVKKGIQSDGSWDGKRVLFPTDIESPGCTALSLAAAASFWEV